MNTRNGARLVKIVDLMALEVFFWNLVLVVPCCKMKYPVHGSNKIKNRYHKPQICKFHCPTVPDTKNKYLKVTKNNSALGWCGVSLVLDSSANLVPS